MEYAEFEVTVALEMASLVESVAVGSVSAPVPTCPGWTISDLGLHVGQFCGFWTHVLCEGTGRPKTPYPEEPKGDDLANWLGSLGYYLLQELRATPSDKEVWTWYESDKSATFVARRCANELAIHRYDAQSARGTCAPITPRLAADGLDEMLTVLVSVRPRTGEATGETLHLHATDSDAEWLIALHPERIDMTPEHAKADLALRGAVSDLELVLYGRPTIGKVEHFGNEWALEVWRREFRF